MKILRFRNKRLMMPDISAERLVAQAVKAAQASVPVLICGESGTGKELIARLIHEKSNRARNPFIAVNCAAIPEGLIEAELFGFEKGAFTGALHQRIGKFEAASQGTLLLDEISEMPYQLQAKLLRVLQEGEIDRIGSQETISINTRIIATANKEPSLLVEQGKFREDLFFRLNVFRIDCPPLRGRKEAIRSMAEAFVVEFSEKHKESQIHLSQDAIEKLVEHQWPGNIRELENVLERAVLQSEGVVLNADEIHFQRLAKNENGKSTGTLNEVEKKHILNVLEFHGGNRSQASSELGISVRTLRNKLKEYRLG